MSHEERRRWALSGKCMRGHDCPEHVSDTKEPTLPILRVCFMYNGISTGSFCSCPYCQIINCIFNWSSKEENLQQNIATEQEGYAVCTHKQHAPFMPTMLSFRGCNAPPSHSLLSSFRSQLRPTCAFQGSQASFKSN